MGGTYVIIAIQDFGKIVPGFVMIQTTREVLSRRFVERAKKRAPCSTFSTPKKDRSRNQVQTSRRASRGLNPLDRTAGFIPALPLTRSSPIFRGLPRAPSPNDSTAPSFLSFSKMMLSCSASVSSGLVRRSKLGVRGRIPGGSSVAPNLPNRSRMVAARVSTSRVPADPTGRDGSTFVYRFDADGNPVEGTLGDVIGETSDAPSASTALVDIAAEVYDHVDENGTETAVEVIRNADGDVMFRFVGDDAEERQARATANVKQEQTPAERAQMLLDEAQELIEQARALQNGEDQLAAATEKAKRAAAAAAEELAPKQELEPSADGTVIMRRERKSPEGGDPLGNGFEHVSKMGIKSIVDGIENMFDNFRRAVSPEDAKLPETPDGTPWGDHEKVPTAGVDVAFDSFGTDDVSPSNGYMSVDAADSEEAREAEEVEEEHARWAETAARVKSTGDASEVETEPPTDDDEAKVAEAIERYSSMGSVVAGAWRPKPIDVTIGGRSYIAYVTPNNLRQLPSGKLAVIDDEDENDDEEKPGDTTTIIMCDPQDDGSNVFMFGLTRTVLDDGSILYRFPSGEALGQSR